jgi:DNA-binding NarL/FixJ family response regulator
MKKIRLLIIEDNSIDKRLIEEHLSVAGNIEFEFAHAFRLKEAFNLLNAKEFDVVTLDLGLPDSHGFETFEKFQSAFPAMPTIVVSGYEDDVMSKKVISSGAHGFIVKGNFDEGSLLREIKLAINKQGFRTTVANKISSGNEIQKAANNPKSAQEKKQELFVGAKPGGRRKLSEKEPEIFQELVSEYLQLIPVSSDTSTTAVKEKVAEFFDKNKEACAMLNLTKDDFIDVHTSALEKLTFIDKNNPNFKSLTAILLQEINIVFAATKGVKVQ